MSSMSSWTGGPEVAGSNPRPRGGISLAHSNGHATGECTGLRGALKNTWVTWVNTGLGKGLMVPAIYGGRTGQPSGA